MLLSERALLCILCSQFHKRVLRLNVIDGDGLGEANGLKWDVVPADQHVLMN